MHAAHTGLAVSPGIGIGPVVRVRNLPFVLTGPSATPRPADEESARFEKACEEVAASLGSTTGTARLTGDPRTMLNDPLFHGSIADRIRCGSTAEDAVVQTTHDLAAIFSELPDPALRARADIAGDLGRSLFRRLHGLPVLSLDHDEPVILVTDEMTAFDAARLHPDRVAGIVCSRGGATSHFAIVVKQLGIPAVSGIEGALGRFADGAICVCDGHAGIAIADPDPAALGAARERRDTDRRNAATLAELRKVRPVTRDGHPVDLWGNIAGPADVQPVLDAGGTGVGMFRTEFVFLGDEPPTEERQTHVYAEILRRMPGPVVMRTLEAGGDKTIPYLAVGSEENPNLGWQGLRMCLDMPDLFLTQLRAMIRASSEGDLWIMFPLISAAWELRECRRLVAEADAAVRKSGGRPGPYKVGIMVEVPAAAVLAKEFLRDFDFCSIGTNDLTQFTLAADRMNPKVARWYDPFHPAVLRLIAMTARAARAAGKPIGMAGDMAANPLAIPLLVGLGFTSLSATAPRIPAVKKALLSVHAGESARLAASVLAMTDAEAIRTRLAEHLEQQPTG